jgi:perosamine synthetase
MTADSPEGQPPLPFARPDLTSREIDAMVGVLSSRWLTTGAVTRDFEAAFAERVGSPHAVALNSCTAALHLALEACGVGPGDLVYVPTYTFAASAEVISHVGATPVLVDVDPTTLCLDSDSLRKVVDADATGKRGTPRAIIPVHFAGVPCDMQPLWRLAREFDLAVVEDAAHAFPAFRHGRPTGWMPADVRGAVCFSFYATKTITTGEGGMAVTPHEDIAERMRTMSLHGLSRQAWNRYTADGSWEYDIVAPGFKYNLTDIAAALGLVQLDRAESMRARRAAIRARYDEALTGLPLVLPSVPDDVVSAHHLYVIRDQRNPADRDQIIAHLASQGIGASVHFIPLHLHTYYREIYGYAPEDFPVATEEFGRALSLPIWSGMDDGDVHRVVECVRESLETA